MSMFALLTMLLMQAKIGGAVHSYAPLLLVRSAIGQNSDPWIKIEAGAQLRGLIILDESMIASSPKACRGLIYSAPTSTATHVGLALVASEGLAHNSSIEPAVQHDVSSYLVYRQSSNLDSHALQKQVISEEALYALRSLCFWRHLLHFCGQNTGLFIMKFMRIIMHFSRCSTTVGCRSSPSSLIPYPPSILNTVGGKYAHIFQPCADGVQRSFSEGEFCDLSPPIQFALLIPLSGLWVLRGAGAAALAVERVNTENALLHGHRLEYSWADSGCSAKQGLAAMGRLLGEAVLAERRIDVVIGPGCSTACEVTSYLSSGIFHPVCSHYLQA